MPAADVRPRGDLRRTRSVTEDKHRIFTGTSRVAAYSRSPSLPSRQFSGEWDGAIYITSRTRKRPSA